MPCSTTAVELATAGYPNKSPVMPHAARDTTIRLRSDRGDSEQVTIIKTLSRP
jgi:hypothetical protein